MFIIPRKQQTSEYICTVIACFAFTNPIYSLSNVVNPTKPAPNPEMDGIPWPGSPSGYRRSTPPPQYRLMQGKRWRCLAPAGIKSGDVGCHQAKTMVDPPVIKNGNEQIPVQMEALMGKPTIYGGCSIAMFDYRRVPKSQNEFHQCVESLARPCQFLVQSLRF